MTHKSVAEVLTVGLGISGSLELPTSQPGWLRFQRHKTGSYIWLQASSGEMRIGASPRESFSFTGSWFYNDMLAKGRQALSEAAKAQAPVLTLADLEDL